MKYGSKRSYNKRYYKSNSKRTYKKNPTTKSLSKKIKKIEKRQELKYFDRWIEISASNKADGSTPGSGPELLNDLITGTDQLTRIGGDVTATSLSFRGFTYVPNLQGVTGNENLSRIPFLRMIIFWDQNATNNPTILGSAITGSESLLDNTGGGDAVFLPYNRSTRSRFKILYDKTYKYPVSPFNTSGGNDNPFDTSILPHRLIQGKVKLNRVVQYSGVGSGIGNIARNALWVVCLSTYDTKIDPPDNNYFIQASIKFRFNYKDD